MKRKRGIICEHGINDMCKGWSIENEWNKKVYQTWHDMIKRVYSERVQKKRPSYINTTLQLEMHWLSYFVEHIDEIEGYDEEDFLNGKLELDKDIKTNGKNKEYSLKNCMFVSKSENCKQSGKTGDKKYVREMNKKEKSIKVEQYDYKMNLIKIWNSISDVKRELGYDTGAISKCCRFWEVNCDKEKWYEKEGNKQYRKTVGKDETGKPFIWKYYKE